MRQTAKVIGEYSNGLVEVELERTSACGQACGACTGCAGVITVKACGGAGTMPGDMVVIESCSRRILGLAALVYLLPLALFFAGYAVNAYAGGLGFALGIALLVPINKVMGKRVVYQVVECIGGKDAPACQ
jgi:sigma-E factor negative regulatory protein RseC